MIYWLSLPEIARTIAIIYFGSKVISGAIYNKFNKFIRLTRYNSKHIAEHGGRQRVSEIRKSRKLIKIKWTLSILLVPYLHIQTYKTLFSIVDDDDEK